MNHCVPEFNMDDEHYSLPSSSSGLPNPRQKKNVSSSSSRQENEIMELLWQNGQVVVQSQNPRLLRKPPPPPSDSTSTQLFMNEDEMISWLQYPLENPPLDPDLITDLFYHPPLTPLRPPLASLHHQIPTRNNEIRESTVVDSSETHPVLQKSKIYLPPRRIEVEVSGGENRDCNSFSSGDGGTIGETCELTLTSSPDGSGATATADLLTIPPEVDRKRKGREPIDDATTNYQSEDAEIESYEEKKQARGANGKRSRAAEVHNLSERRRRDRINEKMKALQELIPRCSKTDKASMLDEAIEYLKSLQLQVQMMSMGCGMVPVMFPGVQQYMPSMGMGMGMDMRMNRPVMPFPAVLSASGLQTPGAPSHMNPRFPLQAIPMPPIQQPSNQADASINPLGMSSHNIARIPNLADSYQQYIGIQHMPMQIPKTQPTSQPGTSKPSTRKGNEGDEKHQSD